MYDPRNFERKKAQPEIPAEKQRLAASLFGGSSSQKAANGGAKVSVPAANLRPGELGAPPRPGVKDKIPNTKQVSNSPLMDLMDMSEGDSFPVPDAKPSYDPFKELESLLDGPSTAASSTSAAPQKGGIDFMSLFDSTPVNASSTSDSDFLSLGHNSGRMDPQAGLMDLNELPVVGGLVQPIASSSTEKKGPSLQNSLQKDAASRQVGVTPTGANPALFQDLFG